MSKKVLVFDFGASSGRAMLADFDGSRIELTEVHRFDNNPVMVCGTFYWDVLGLFHEIKQGITKAKALGDFSTIGIDTWGVDFGLLEKKGNLLQNPIHYRDTRTAGMIEKAAKVVGKAELYKASGIQLLELNTIYQLTENNHADLARQMLQNLSVHLRYTLSSGQTVSLLEELKLVKNYVELSSIRYPGALRLLPSCEESLHNATVVPLMLLNFVENTVKYEVVMGKVLDIHIDVTAREKNQCTRLHICIWDTGRGFSENMLAVLQNLDTYVNSEQEHIGITNVVLRLRQIFPDAAFTFCNRSGAGAQITIDFPYVPFFRIDG